MGIVRFFIIFISEKLLKLPNHVFDAKENGISSENIIYCLFDKEIRNYEITSENIIINNIIIIKSSF